MKEKKYSIQDHKADIVCPYCGFSKTVDVSKYLIIKNKYRLKIRCKCSKMHIGVFERRQRHRKNTQLPGQYFLGLRDDGLIVGQILVKDISISGVKFQLVEDKQQDLKIGDRMAVEFRLNDRPGAVISRNIVIKNVNDTTVNAQFLEKVSFEKDVSLKVFLSC